MKKIILLVCGLFFLIPLSGCFYTIKSILGSSQNSIRGSSQVITTRYTDSNFNKISISNTCNAVITYADSFSIKITVNGNIQNNVNVIKENSLLRIFLDKGVSYRNITFNAYITLPDIQGIYTSGASDAQLNGFSSNNPFDVKLSGASEVTGNITCGDADFTLSGASDINISGKANNLDCKISGASDCFFGNFACNNVYVKCSGASEIVVNASGTISGKLSGASELYYYGNPTLGYFNTSGSSEIKRK